MKRFDYGKLAEQIDNLSKVIEKNTILMDRMVGAVAQPLKEGRMAINRLNTIINENC